MIGSQRAKRHRINSALARQAATADVRSSWGIAEVFAEGWFKLIKLFAHVFGATIVLGVGYLLYRAVTLPAILIMPMSVTTELADKGFTPDAVAFQIKIEIKKLLDQAQRRGDIASFQVPLDSISLSVPQTGMSLDDLAGQLRSFLGIRHTWKISGRIVGDEEEYRLLLVADNITEQYYVDSKMHGNLDAVIAGSAADVLEAIEPYQLASALRFSNPVRSRRIAERLIYARPDTDPNVMWAHTLLSSLYYLSKRAKDAEKEALTALKYDPENPHALLNLGNALSLKGDNEAAMAQYLRAASANPGYTSTYIAIGNLLRRQSSYEAARASYLKAIELDFTDYQAYLGLGNVERDLGNLDAAMTAYQRSIAKKPDYAFAHNALGSLLLYSGELDGAEDSFQLAIEADRFYSYPHCGLGLVLVNRGDYQKAIVEFDEAIRLDEAYADPHRHKATALVRLGRIQKGIEALEKATNLAPSNKEYQAALRSASAIKLGSR